MKKYSIMNLMKIMNVKTKKTQWVSLCGEPQLIKIVPPRDGCALMITFPRIDSDCENKEQALEECKKTFDRDFSDLYLKVVEY